MSKLGWNFVVFLAMASVASAQQETEVSALVQTAKVVSRCVGQTISAYGVVEADSDGLIVVALPRAGLITRLYVRLGERVKAGDPLLVLDTAPGTRMEYTQARAQQQYAQGQLERVRGLFNEQLATRDQIAGAEQALSDATARLSALQDVGADQNQQTLLAVADGIVTGLSINAGDRVTADTPAMFLAQLTGLVVRLGIEPEDARRLPDHAPLELESVFRSGFRVSSRLKKIGAMINPATRLIDAIASVPDDAVSQLTLGSAMRAELKLAERKTLLVPRSSVLRDQDGAYVYVVERSRARRVNVSVVYESSTEVGIDSEIEQGSIVVKTGNYELTSGMLLRVQNSAR